MYCSPSSPPKELLDLWNKQISSWVKITPGSRSVIWQWPSATRNEFFLISFPSVPSHSYKEHREEGSVLLFSTRASGQRPEQAAASGLFLLHLCQGGRAGPPLLLRSMQPAMMMFSSKYWARRGLSLDSAVPEEHQLSSSSTVSIWQSPVFSRAAIVLTSPYGHLLYSKHAVRLPPPL